jgi:hypothetical protein
MQPLVTEDGILQVKTSPGLKPFIILAALLFAGAASVNSARADHGMDAFVYLAGASDNVLPAHAKAGKGWEVRANPRALERAHVTFHMPDGRTMVAERTRDVTSGRGRSWVGKLQGASGGIVVMSQRKGVFTGIIDDGETLYELLPGRAGQALFFQVDQTRLPPFARPLLAENLDSSGGSGSGAPPTAGENTVQDVMMLYTPAVRASYGSVAITEAAILDAVVAVNQAYTDSQVNIQLNTVHIGEVAYNEDGNMSNTLVRLRTTNDGYMDEVHGWRDAYGADLVAMISMDTNACGIAYVMSSNSSGFSPYAFSVTKKSCVSGATLDHEIGHNQGNCHNREETGCTTPAYAYGYGLCGPAFRTIMSYSSPCGTSKIRHFSNPNVSVSGFPTGIDHNIDPANSADAARTMNNTAATIAAFRTGTVSPPQSPSGLNANAASETRIDLDWADNSGDESGFELERSLDGASWSLVATLAANTTSHADTGLAASTLYYYRVRAHNSAGTSGWSNTANAQTQAPPLPPAAPDPLTATPLSGSEIDLSWTNVANEDGYRIERSADGVSYALIASPQADATGYSDNGLSPATTYYYRVTAFNSGGDSAPASAMADTVSFTEEGAVAETTTYGSVSGNYTNTWGDDGVAEVISETESGGKKSRRTTRLQHEWQFNLPAGNSAMVTANAWQTGSGEDAFRFEYSTNGSTYDTLFTVSSGDTAQEHTALLPLGTAGLLYVRVVDTDRTQGNRNVESIHIDHLYVRVEGGSVGTPPLAPQSLSASAMSASQVDLSWQDMSGDEMGFEIQRSTDGSSWQSIANAPADATAYSDTSVAGGMLYYYRINAFNAAGASSWDGPVTAQTPVGLALSVNAYKVKGVQHADLSWTGGGASATNIYRDGNQIGTVAGGTSSYTDNIGNKGGGSYVYEVCDAVTGSCSNQANATF